MPEDWNRYALAKAYLHVLDRDGTVTVESMSERLEEFGEPFTEITTGQIRRFIDSEEN